ncbi:MAG: hypothetical protein HQM10_17710 [Candidatus Riflebacteria bacterium]|nr:hypothetical protein [Candidatus Riflebacteria bacterium]
MKISVSHQSTNKAIRGLIMEAEIKPDDYGKFMLNLDNGDKVSAGEDFLRHCTVVDATIEELQTLENSGFKIRFDLDDKLMLLRGYVSGRFEEKEK